MKSTVRQRCKVEKDRVMYSDLLKVPLAEHLKQVKIYEGSSNDSLNRKMVMRRDLAKYDPMRRKA